MRPTAKTPAKRDAAVLRAAYRLMRAHFGHQDWWPGDTPFEVCVGAILTQNTAWTNVERAIANLKTAGALDPHRLLALTEKELAGLIRPAGYFNVKERRLRAFVRALVEHYGGQVGDLLSGPTPEVRARLLALHGIGPETADSILLYAGEHLSFVVDAYTKRIFSRHGWWKPSGRSNGAKSNSRGEYESLKQLCEGRLQHRPAAARLDYWRDYHAQLVMVGKHYCRNRQPDCAHCPLRGLLPSPGGVPETAVRKAPDSPSA